MKQTIKADNARKVIKQEYLNDNSLYEISVVDDIVKVTVRFIESSSIKEHTILTMPAEKFPSEVDERIKFSEDGKMIAVFRREGNNNYLDRLYDLEEHSFSICDFMEIEYKNHFNNPVLDSCLSYQKVKKDD